MKHIYSTNVPSLPLLGLSDMVPLLLSVSLSSKGKHGCQQEEFWEIKMSCAHNIKMIKLAVAANLCENTHKT